jgi:transcriptional antiterminator
MGLFWNRKSDIKQEKGIETDAYAEIDEMKQRTHETAKEANRNIKKLNDLLLENGITLNISIAAGGRHGRR